MRIMSTDAVLKQTLERATALPEEDKLTIIRVVDGYCMAVGLRQQFSPENQHSFLPNAKWYKDSPKGVLEEQDPAQLNEDGSGH